MFNYILNRHKYKGIEATMLRQFWTLIEKKQYRIAVVGSRSSINHLAGFADAEQRACIRLRLGRLEIRKLIPQLKHRVGGGDGGIDLVLIADQKRKHEILSAVTSALTTDIPVYILPEDFLSHRIQRSNAGEAYRRGTSPRLSYVLASSRRTGSTMLCHLLCKTGVAGYPSEFIELKFNAAAEQKRIQAGKVLTDAIGINQTENGVFGIKVHWSALDSFREKVHSDLGENDRRRFEGLLAESKYLYLTRNNKIRQAISDWRATQTSVYHVHLDDKARVAKQHRGEVPYNYQELIWQLKSVVEDDRSWQQFFDRCGISPLHIIYEEMVDKPVKTVGDILDYLGLSTVRSEVSPNTERLADAFTETVYGKFVAELTAEFGSGLVDELTGGSGSLPVMPRNDRREQPGRRASVLVSLATTDYLEMAKQFFASAHFNGGWDGDYLLLAHNVPEEELTWFRERHIHVKHCRPLYDDRIGGMHSVVTSKYYLFEPWIKQWKTVIYSDLDAIVRAPLDGLKTIRGFAAVDDWSTTLQEQIVNRADIRERGLDPVECDRLLQQARKSYRLHRWPFCSGFFVFSTDIVNENTLREIQKMTDQYQLISKFGDQLAMNFYFYGQWQKLNPTYNVLVRQKNYRDSVERFLNVETRWGSVQDLSAYILHVFDPKPWSPSSSFYLEWLSNLLKAQQMTVGVPPILDDRKLLDVQRTEQQIHFRQQIYNLVEGFGPVKVPTIKALQFLHWHYITAKKAATAAARAMWK